MSIGDVVWTVVVALVLTTPLTIGLNPAVASFWGMYLLAVGLRTKQEEDEED